MAGNLTRLGRRAGLVASVGEDDMGQFLLRFVKDLGLDIRGVQQVDLPSTLILVTRSREVSNFEAYRLADCQITEQQITDELLAGLKIFHTTCFALSQEPARSAILTAASKVVQAGGQVSIDANYAAKIWPDQQEAQAIVAQYCAGGALVKFSEVDWERLYGHPLNDAEKAANYLHQLGAKTVCLTFGDKGSFVSNNGEQHFLEARKVQVKDTTGAGDAFWSGFLCAHLDGKSLLTCAKAGRRMAELKLGHFGPLPAKVEREELYD
ncbi:MAG: carbohydrate kinase family protein, partial [Bacteroidota bacterium]